MGSFHERGCPFSWSGQGRIGETPAFASRRAFEARPIAGILDTTEAFWPWGYSIDIPNQLIEAFDPALKPLSASHPPPEGTVVRWLTESGSRRPFVRLSDGRLALLDTGSGFGLALSGA